MKLSLAFGIIFFLGFLGLAFMHEQVHIAIWRGYGIESHIEYFSYFPDLVTVSNEACPSEGCELAHSMNEVVGYPLLVFYIVFGAGLLILIGLNEKNPNNVDFASPKEQDLHTTKLKSDAE